MNIKIVDIHDEMTPTTEVGGNSNVKSPSMFSLSPKAKDFSNRIFSMFSWSKKADSEQNPSAEMKHETEGKSEIVQKEPEQEPGLTQLNDSGKSMRKTVKLLDSKPNSHKKPQLP